MAFSYTAALQGRIALAVWNVQNSVLTAAQKVQLDNTWTSGALSGGVAYDAQIEVAAVAQYIEEVSNTSFPEPAWDRLFVAKAAMILAKTVRPDRYDELVKDHDRAEDWAIDTYTPSDIVSATITGQPLTVAGLRSHTRSRCIRRKEPGVTGMKRRIWATTADVDSEIQWVINWLWNKTQWNFRAREVTLTITPLSITDATYSHSGKTLTKTNGITITTVAGQPLFVTSGTGATTGIYTVASQTSDDVITLVTSIGSAADTQTDIDFVTYAVTMRGLASNESFDSIASEKFFYESTVSGELRWLDKGQGPAARAAWGSDTGQPVFFRTQPVAQSIVWHLYPIPDTTYNLYGTVYISTPLITTLAEINTAIGLFPAEFGTVIRDAVFARVLEAHGASDAGQKWKRVEEQADILCPLYTDQGTPPKSQSVNDVYGDFNSLLSSGDGSGAFGYA